MKSGAWYSFKEERIGQGRENSKIFLKEHPEMMAEIEGLIRAHHGLDGQVEVPVPDEKEFEDVPLDLK